MRLTTRDSPFTIRLNDSSLLKLRVSESLDQFPQGQAKPG